MYPKLISIALIHIFVICLSNVLVQHPFTLLNFHTTWGAFSYPLVFICTDLTTRLIGATEARKVIYFAMLPALILSFFISNWFDHGYLWVLNVIVFRIALASLLAYVLGQLLDIFFFQRLRHYGPWWVAPSIASIFGNILDTFCFFFIAFYHSNNLYLSAHWVEIATVDLGFKILISLISFVPLYGLLLNWLIKQRAFADLKTI
ncbi:7-cyano-7-deazaguanine/7-aminomethyl-7-deazaguanine transporter [Legionella gresilensis]|uniref:7-cyano-7-deazaguanine/7-aminomethyl-7- deazaguanine transporter n=1 Tax=Legionella gresilensis TaxID=91823 RepID=UPI00104166D8|nr:7-cyano-7-deazaguanine/7-aminomethyl-7-deazaguanine transporter [Legionella gresilensis]